MKRMRVLVAYRPRLMRELVMATIADQPDIEVVGEVLDETRIAETAEEARPDVLLLAMENPEKQSALCGFLLGRYPEMRILALAPERNKGIHFWAVVDIRSEELQSCEANVLQALRTRPPTVTGPVV
jgi:chemotaxis response regulator CheB